MPTLISPGELIDQSWERYRARLPQLLSISAWLLVKAFTDIFALSFYPTVSTIASGATLTGSEQMGVVLFMLSNAVIAPLIGVWVVAALVRFVHTDLKTGRPDLRTAMRDGWKYYIPTLVVSMLVLLVLLGGVAIGIAPPVFLATVGAYANIEALIILGNALLVVGVIVALVLNMRWSVFLFMAPYAVLTDDARGKAALLRSRELVRGRFWDVLLRYAVPKAVFILLGMVVMFILSQITSVAVSAASGLNLDVQLRLMTITSTVYPILIAVAVNPILVIADVLLYRSLSNK